MINIQRTVARVECGLIYLSSAIGNQTIAIKLEMSPMAKPGDVLEITMENENPKAAKITSHVNLNSNDK